MSIRNLGFFHASRDANRSHLLVMPKYLKTVIVLVAVLVICGLLLQVAYLTGYIGPRNTRLLRSAYLGNWARVIKLIEGGVDVNATNNRGHTVLILASYRNNQQLVESLIQKGADVNAKDRSGYTPLHCAARAGQWQNAQILMENGADLNARDRHGDSPLLNAAAADSKELVEILLNNGAEVNIKNDRGWTPLHAAIRAWKPNSVINHRYYIVELLVKSGADVNARNRGGSSYLGDSHIGKRLGPPNEGETPLEIAMSNGYTDIVQLLKKYGAQE